MSIAFGIISVFVFLGVLLPFINAAFDVTGSNLNTASIGEKVGGEVSERPSVTGFKVLASVLKMFFWTFGDLPFWLDMVLLIFRIILALILLKYVPYIGSGG